MIDRWGVHESFSPQRRKNVVNAAEVAPTDLLQRHRGPLCSQPEEEVRAHMAFLRWKSGLLYAGKITSAAARGKRRSASSVVIGGLLGSVVGWGAGVAWKSRHFAGAATTKAMRSIHAVRDAHWLEQNPIDYA